MHARGGLKSVKRLSAVAHASNRCSAWAGIQPLAPQEHANIRMHLFADIAPALQPWAFHDRMHTDRLAHLQHGQWPTAPPKGLVRAS